jgi:hypothetical protein
LHNPELIILETWLTLKLNVMLNVCSLNQAIKLFKGDATKVKAYCKEKGITISSKALEARLKTL